MQIQSLVLFAAASTTALARPFGGSSDPGSFDQLFASSCDLSQAQLPTNPGSATQLPSPTGNLFHVAIGRGTQNYTCDLSEPTAVPVSIGAVATLFNVTCLAATSPQALAIIPPLILDIPRDEHAHSPLHLLDFDISGHHYFESSTTPVFNLNTPNGQFGITFALKNTTIAAPPGSPVGQHNHGYGAVAWAYLTPNSSFTDNAFSQIYRVNTAGGDPPTTCTGANSTFVVNYAAEYWFYQ